jgi:EpsG family
MWPYLFILGVAMVLAVITPMHHRRLGGFWLFCFVMVLFVGLRYEVGTDWFGYEYIYQKYAHLGLGEVIYVSEPGFFLINKFADWAGWGLQGVMLICGAVFTFGVFQYAATTYSPWISISMVLPYLVFVIGMSGIRQAAAIGIGFFIFSRWNKMPVWVKALLIGLAISVHNSAAFFLLLAIMYTKGNRFVRLILGIAVAYFVLSHLQSTDAFDKYKAVYVEQKLSSTGAFLHILLNAVPAAVYLIWRGDVHKACGPSSPIILIGSMVAVGALFASAYSPTGVDRITLYLSYLQMWIYPALVKTWGGGRQSFRAGVLLVPVVVFIGFFVYGAQAESFLPYRNAFFKF